MEAIHSVEEWANRGSGRLVLRIAVHTTGSKRENNPNCSRYCAAASSAGAASSGGVSLTLLALRFFGSVSDSGLGGGGTKYRIRWQESQ